MTNSYSNQKKKMKWEYTCNSMVHVQFSLLIYFRGLVKSKKMYWITNNYVIMTFPHEKTLEIVQTGEAIPRSSQTSFTNQQIIRISSNIFPSAHLGFLKSFLFCMLVFKSRFFLCFFSKRSIIFSWRRKKKPYTILIKFNL